jgi:hypothetical protein
MMRIRSACASRSTAQEPVRISGRVLVLGIVACRSICSPLWPASDYALADRVRIRADQTTKFKRVGMHDYQIADAKWVSMPE